MSLRHDREVKTQALKCSRFYFQDFYVWMSKNQWNLIWGANVHSKVFGFLFGSHMAHGIRLLNTNTVSESGGLALMLRDHQLDGSAWNSLLLGQWESGIICFPFSFVDERFVLVMWWTALTTVVETSWKASDTSGQDTFQQSTWRRWRISCSPSWVCGGKRATVVPFSEYVGPGQISSDQKYLHCSPIDADGDMSSTSLLPVSHCQPPCGFADADVTLY